MITGRRRFQAASQAQLIGAILKDEPPPIVELVPDVPPSSRSGAFQMPRQGSRRPVADGERPAVRVALDRRFSGGRDSAIRGRDCSHVGSSAHCGWRSSSPRIAVPCFGRGAAMSVPARPAPRHPRSASRCSQPTAWRSIPATVCRLRCPRTAATSSMWAPRPTGRHNCGFARCIPSVEQALPGTEGANTPFWSPDSQWIGFFAANSLKKVRVSSGLTQVIATNVQTKGGAAWNADDVIVFPAALGGLSRVSAQGGPVTPVTTGEGSHFWPQFLGDGQHFIYADSVSRSIRIGSLDNEPPRTLMKFPVRISSLAYVPGYIFFVQDASLFARPFDEKRLEFSGEADPSRGRNSRQRSRTRAVLGIRLRCAGVLAVPGRGSRRPFIGSRGMAARPPAVDSPAQYAGFALSPDARRLVFSRAAKNGGADLWLRDVG